MKPGKNLNASVRPILGMAILAVCAGLQCLVLWLMCAYLPHLAGFYILVPLSVVILLAIAIYMIGNIRYFRQFNQVLETKQAKYTPETDRHGEPKKVTSFLEVIQLLEQMETHYENLLLNREATLNVLQSQINPHFLYNTLDSIRSDVMEAGVEKPAEMLEELATFFRYNVSEKRLVISLREELRNVESYMRIMQYRLGNRVVLVRKVDMSDDELMDFQMPKMILQPLVENCIQHGLESRLGEGVITLHIVKTDRHVEILVQDNGLGMGILDLQRLRRSIETGVLEQTDQPKKRGGLALPNVNNRLKLLFGAQYGLAITSAEGMGTEIKILMPRTGGDLHGAVGGAYSLT